MSDNQEKPEDLQKIQKPTRGRPKKKNISILPPTADKSKKKPKKTIKTHSTETQLANLNNNLYEGLTPDEIRARQELATRAAAMKSKELKNAKMAMQENFISMLEKRIDKDGKPMTFMEAFNEEFINAALNPNSQVFKFLADRLYSNEILGDIDRQLNRQRNSDKDFQEYRVLKKAFDIQQQVLLSKSKDIGIMAGRRAGKSETNKLKAIIQSVTKNSQRTIIIGLTIQKTLQIYWDDVIKLLESLGLDYRSSNTEGKILLQNDSLIQFGGNSNKVEREKYRGSHWDLVIIDEAQSQQELGSFVAEIIKPMLLDTDGTLMLTGSGPRTRGTFWEKFYNNPSETGLRLNWNLSKNPNIFNYKKVLEEIKIRECLKETDSLFIREYLGQIAYDDDALVFRLNDNNFYTDDELTQWISQQSPEDIRFVGGLDYGYVDSDAFIIMMYSERSNEKFLVYEYKKSGTDVTTLINNIEYGKQYIKSSPLFINCYYKDLNIYADTSDQKISLEMSTRYSIPVFPAIKHEKALAIQTLQDDIRKGHFKIKKGSNFEEECLRTIYKRVEKEGSPSIITKEIDDEVYHPDLMDAVLYSLRNYWLTHSHNMPNSIPIDRTQQQTQNEYWDNLFNSQDYRRNNEQLY